MKCAFSRPFSAGARTPFGLRTIEKCADCVAHRLDSRLPSDRGGFCLARVGVAIVGHHLLHIFQYITDALRDALAAADADDLRVVSLGTDSLGQACARTRTNTHTHKHAHAQTRTRTHARAPICPNWSTLVW